MATPEGLAPFARAFPCGMPEQAPEARLKDRFETLAIYALLGVLFVGSLASIVIRLGEAFGLVP